jgi:diguanylate cyclase (GGDEF)-like protein
MSPGQGFGALALMLLCALWPRPLLAAQPHPQALPTLTTAHAVRQLTLQEASRAYPVHLKAVVVCYNLSLNSNHPVLVVTDATASIFVELPGWTKPALNPGTMLDVRGVSTPGEFAPIINHAQVRILGKSHLPLVAPTPTMRSLLNGSEDAQWVQLEGVIQAVEFFGHTVTMKLAIDDREITAVSETEPGVDYNSLIDADVRIRGVAATSFNHRNQITGISLIFPGVATIQVEQAARANPFQSPVRSISDLMTYSPDKDSFVHRAHLRGVVSLYWPGRLLCIQEGRRALCANTAQTTSLILGEEVDVLGFPRSGALTPSMTNLVFRSHSAGHTPTMLPIDADKVLHGENDGQLIQTEALLIEHDRAAPDPTIVVTSGKHTFEVVLPKSADTRAMLALEDGSRLKLTGICSMQAAPRYGGGGSGGNERRDDEAVEKTQDGYPKGQSFRILLRSSNDVVVLRKPTWWTAAHLLPVLALALLVTLAVLCWVLVLRNRVKQQTEKLRYQATYDALTGLQNRRAILDALRRERERSARSGTKVAVMILDADHFKKVNDTYGHLAGDAVLKELATRIQQAVRSYDLTGRYGGEEFLIVLPGCNEEEALICAERVRSFVAAGPILAEGIYLDITVSVGAAILDPLRNTEKEALAAADIALYQAKQTGRNRVVCGGLELLTQSQVPD